MHTDEEYRQILRLWEQGFKKKRISIMTGINRTTVRECISRFHSVSALDEDRRTKPKQPTSLISLASGNAAKQLAEYYAYLLGMYLGDGYINKEPRTYKLRISLDTTYSNIVEECACAITVLLPFNSVMRVKRPYNCVDITSLNSYWPEFFPQHGPGMKHTRAIVLKAWQSQVIEQHPLLFFRGLYHSDGCRDHNTVKGKDYPRYSFKNNSDDIRRLFSDTCDRLGLHWTTASNGLTIQIARRADVVFLDQHIGPKS